MDDAALLSSLRSRSRKGRWGVGNAATYLSSMQGCLDGGVCPSRLFAHAPANAWDQAIKDSSERLTYCAPGMRVLKDSARRVSTPGAIMEFECIITTTRKDRDGDVLDTKGAQPDPLMPLLWQHIPIEPIGKLLEITKHTAKELRGRFAIADVELGRDAATLIEFGALRISHGFSVLDGEPLDDDLADATGEDGPIGWHITKFAIMETSVVSVPSNVDAVILAYSKHKLHSPLIKSWGRSLYEKRKLIVPGWALTEGRGKEADPRHTFEPQPTPKPESKSCACKGTCGKCSGHKYNENHDPHTGQFTSGDGGSAGDKPGSGKPSGPISAVSPNIDDHLTFSEAEQRIRSQRHVDMVARFRDADARAGLTEAKAHDVVGDWSDGAEDSVLTAYRPGSDYDRVRYSAALKGLAADQKAVVVFNPVAHGKDTLWNLKFNRSPEEVRSLLDKHGVQFRSLAQKGYTTSAQIIDIDTQHSPAIAALQKELGNDISIKWTTGTGEFIGGDTRAAGRRAYRSVIEDFEQRHRGGRPDGKAQRAHDHDRRHAARRRLVTPPAFHKHTHVRVECSCGAVILQCRCPGPHEVEVRPHGCEACRKLGAAGKNISRGAIAPISPEGQSMSVKAARLSDLQKDHIKCAGGLMKCVHDHEQSTDAHKALMEQGIKCCKSAHPYPDDYTGDDPHDESGQDDPTPPGTPTDTIDPDHDNHNHIPDENSFAPTTKGAKGMTHDCAGHLSRACHMVKAAYHLDESNEVHKAMLHRCYKHLQSALMGKDYGMDDMGDDMGGYDMNSFTAAATKSAEESLKAAAKALNDHLESDPYARVLASLELL